MLDLVLVHASVSADMCVVMLQEGSMVHHAVVAWVHVAGEGLGAACSLNLAVVGAHPPVLHLTPHQLAAFRATDWVPLLTNVQA